MNSQCLPFSEIPHTTKLFSDYISDFSKLERFYSATPYGSEWIHDNTSTTRYESARRERVAAILERQNRNWGASPKTLENIDRLRSGASVVVTGQQAPPQQPKPAVEQRKPNPKPTAQPARTEKTKSNAKAAG